MQTAIDLLMFGLVGPLLAVGVGVAALTSGRKFVPPRLDATGAACLQAALYLFVGATLLALAGRILGLN
jgi:hypothetical protein